MTNSEINRKMAESMVWHEEVEKHEYLWAPGHITYLPGPWWVDDNGEVKWLVSDWTPATRIEQAAMVEDEIAKDKAKQILYCNALIRIIGTFDTFALVHATPLQRCLAVIEATKGGDVK